MKLDIQCKNNNWQTGEGNGNNEKVIGYFNTTEECGFAAYTKYPDAKAATWHYKAPHECYANFEATDIVSSGYGMQTCIFNGNE